MLQTIKKFFVDENAKALKQAEPIIKKTNDFESKIKELSDTELSAQTEKFRGLLKDGQTLDEIMPEAFATVREVSSRLLKMRHYDNQILGGAVLHDGDIAEMRTGEGKTLVATLPVYLNAIEGKGVHVVTVNDYLSKRDAVWMGQIYNFLGLSVGILNQDISYLYTNENETKENDKERDNVGSYKVEDEFIKVCTRQEAYAADITYGTNNEFGFDYLRDNTEYSKSILRQRGYNFAIVDEVDSILIDEARTPLIISAPAEGSDELYKQFTVIARTLHADKDYVLDEKFKAVQLTDAGIEKAESALGIDNIYTDKGIKYVHHLETSVRAKALFEKDRDYVVRDGEIVIIDEFTGRMQPGRRWSEGLHQAIESKEGVEIQKESRTFASITFQNYFRLYKKLSGMTGTAVTSSEEFYKVYGLNTVELPTNKVPQRIDHDDLIFQTENGKYMALSKMVKELQEKGQPVLIGTVSVEKNELLSAYLKKEGVKHNALNAKNHENEGEIVADAGKRGSVTVATNMAGRGVDIKLGGAQASKDEYEEVLALGGLYVIGTERHEARRIDNQLRGRSGRQGDAGETQFYVSLDDTLMRVFASDMIKTMMGRFGFAEDQPIDNKMITNALEKAQDKIEGFNFDSRKQVLAYDDILNMQRQSVYQRRYSVLTGNNDAVEKELSRISEIDPEIKDILDKKRKELGDDEFIDSARRVLLQTTDMLWVEHLEVMDYTRQSVNLRAWGQRDPLIEYKKEGLRLFHEMEQSYIAHVVDLISKLQEGMFAEREQVALQDNRDTEDSQGVVQSGNPAMPHTVGEDDKIGRNDKCPCGSGKKYKKCGMVNSEEHQNRLREMTQGAQVKIGG